MSKDKKRKILVVDDEPDNASVFTMSLEDRGFEVDTFTDPLLALSTFKMRLYNNADVLFSNT